MTNSVISTTISDDTDGSHAIDLTDGDTLVVTSTAAVFETGAMSSAIYLDGDFINVVVDGLVSGDNGDDTFAINAFGESEHIIVNGQVFGDIQLAGVNGLVAAHGDINGDVIVSGIGSTASIDGWVGGVARISDGATVYIASGGFVHGIGASSDSQDSTDSVVVAGVVGWGGIGSNGAPIFVTSTGSVGGGIGLNSANTSVVSNGTISHRVDSGLSGFAIDVRADGGEITIGAAGFVDGTIHFDADVTDGKVINHGAISSDIGSAVALGVNTLFNHGSLGSSGSGSAVTVSGGRIVNTGTIADDEIAIVFTAKAGETVRIDNSGTIEGGLDSVLHGKTASLTVKNSGLWDADTLTLTYGNDRAVNTGTITAGIKLMNGNDVFDGRFGHAAGVIDGGAGNDTIRGGTDDDTLLGGSGADVLIGKAGDDILTGGAGKDTLSGKSGEDMFVYKAVTDSITANYDTITDFNANLDHIDFFRKVTGVDSAVKNAALTADHLAKNIETAIAGHLQASHAILLKASAGDLAGHVFLVIDGNGTAGYQTGHDVLIDVTGMSGTLAVDAFV
jgi:hypothetical protein